MMKAVFICVVILLLGATATRADEVWSCSVIEDGKPQVIKLTLGHDTVMKSDWGSRLLQKYGIGDDEKLRLITNTTDALVAIGEPGVAKERGQRPSVSLVMFVINKFTGEMSRTMISTAEASEEIKGSCTK